MYERTRSPSSGFHGCTNATAKMASDIGPRKTMFVLVIVVGCFAILWPKVFYPMLVGSADQHMKPSPIDKTTGCCDVFSEVDINTIKIMSELCGSIVEQSSEKPLSGKEIVAKCKAEVQQTCGIDISAVLQEQIRLGRSVKQILSEVRSLNGSLCLKYHYGVAPWRLGVPHRIAVAFTTNVRQERPPHMRPESIHPAFRERGSAIPRPSGTVKKAPKIVEGRPGPVPGMRPTLGGAGHGPPPSQKTGSSMSVIMPIYTIGIVIFFTYTLMKLLFKKQPDGVGGSLYPPVDPDPRFRKEVFESERCRYTPRLSRDPTGKIVVNAMSALLDEVDEEIEARRKSNRLQVPNQAKTVSDHSLANGNLANGSVPKQHDQEQTSVKILGMETTASCEGGEKWNKPVELIVPVPHPVEPPVPPQEIYLQGALPAQSQILVADSAVVTEPATNDINSDPAVVLAGKMTLSVISMDSAYETDKSAAEIKAPSVEREIVEALDLNGDLENIEDDAIDESKYTTASSATVAENEISEEDRSDNEMDEDVEKINDLEFEVNHVSDLNGAEARPEIEEEEIEEILLDDEPEIEELQKPERVDDSAIQQNEELSVEETKTPIIDTSEKAESDVKINDDVQEIEVEAKEPQIVEIQPLVKPEVEEKNTNPEIEKISIEETEIKTIGDEIKPEKIVEELQRLEADRIQPVSKVEIEEKTVSLGPEIGSELKPENTMEELQRFEADKIDVEIKPEVKQCKIGENQKLEANEATPVEDTASETTKGNEIIEKKVENEMVTRTEALEDEEVEVEDYDEEYEEEEIEVDDDDEIEEIEIEVDEEEEEVEVNDRKTKE